MDPDGNRLQNSGSPRHWGHSTMHRVPPVSETTTTMCMCVCVCVCSLLLGNPIFKDPYLLARVV